MGCCQKKKINKESINDELYNENLIPDNITISDSPSNIPSTRISLDASSTSLDDFKKLEVIGQGSFGKVFLVKNINNNKIYAMKVLEKKFLIQKKQISHTKTERIALEKLKHPFIVKLNYAFQDITNVYFVTEFLSGGELFFHLRKKAGFKEKDVKFYMSQVLSYPCPNNISGAKYSAVPHNVNVVSFGLTILLNPKSVNFI